MTAVGELWATPWTDGDNLAILPTSGFTSVSSGENRSFPHTAHTDGPQLPHRVHASLTSKNRAFPQLCRPSTSTAVSLYSFSLKNRVRTFVGTTGFATSPIRAAVRRTT